MYWLLQSSSFLRPNHRASNRHDRVALYLYHRVHEDRMRLLLPSSRRRATELPMGGTTSCSDLGKILSTIGSRVAPSSSDAPPCSQSRILISSCAPSRPSMGTRLSTLLHPPKRACAKGGSWRLALQPCSLSFGPPRRAFFLLSHKP